MKKRMSWRSGYNTDFPITDGLNVENKLRSFRASLWNSYQGEFITFKDKRFRCLINPDKLKENYDQKEISIDFDAEMHNGDVFLWDRTNTHWLTYLQRYEEEAYFRAQIRRCDYQIDVDGTPYWIYVRGPVETAIIWRQKHEIEMNDMNYSILFYITKNDETDAFFTRFKKVQFENHTWRVAAVDRYSQDGIIEVYLEEYFDNEIENEMVEPKIIIPDKRQAYIEGPQIVKPFDTNLEFKIINSNFTGEFVVNSSKVKIIKSDETSCVLEILTGKSTSFELCYTDNNGSNVVLPITVKSL